MPFSTIHFSLAISATNAALWETVMTAPRKFLRACVSAASVVAKAKVEMKMMVKVQGWG